MCLIFRFSSCPVFLLRTYSDHQIVMSSMYKAFKSFCCFLLPAGRLVASLLLLSVPPLSVSFFFFSTQPLTMAFPLLVLTVTIAFFIAYTFLNQNKNVRQEILLHDTCMSRFTPVHFAMCTFTFLTVSVSPGVAHAWGTVLPLSVPLMSPLSWPLSFLVSFLVPTGIIIPGFRVVYYWGPGRRHTSRHGWRISSLGWGRKGQSGDLGSAFPETNFAQIYNNKDFYSCGQHVLTDRNRRSWVESSEVLCV